MVLYTRQMGMALAGIELRYLVDQISDRVRDYYVSNIYGISRDSVLFKLHHTEKDDVFMMVTTFGIWLTSVKIDQIEPNRLQKRLRSDLLRLKLKEVGQVGSERVAYLTFAGFGKEFVVVGEFFGDGNIILCNGQMKILALQHSIDVRHRKLGVGLEYAPPPQNGLDALDASEADFAPMRLTDLPAAKWLGRTMGLPKRYVEGIFGIAGVDPKTAGSRLSDGDAGRICATTMSVVADVAAGRHEPAIIRGDKTEAVPLRLGADGGDCTAAESFIAGLDAVFTESLVERGKKMQTSGSEKRIRDLESQLSEQQRAIHAVKEKAGAITTVANSIYQMISDGITSIEDGRARAILEANNAMLGSERGVQLVVVGDEKIRVDHGAPLQSIASALFDAAKKQSGAVGTIERVMEKTRKRLDGVDRTEGAVRVSEIRKKSWYERYRWFFTTDGLLAIGGRDAASNSAVVRKRLGKDDRVFHGDIFGSPFFILKGGHDAPAASMSEAAHATVCFSRAWREGMYGLSAYWVSPGQVKKSAPSGQFLPKGSFTIEGQRNYVRISSLRLAVGMIRRDDGHAITCGPPEAVKRASVCYAVIEPHGSDMAEVAKRIRVEFLKLEEDAVRAIGMDDFVRALPAGQSQIKEVGRGDA